MAKGEGKPGDLGEFAQLDLGELYYLGDRRAVERGLRYFRDYAVESLSWDGRSRRITAQVSGTGFAPYEVLLWVRHGHVEHECECPAWSNFGACKHGVAALAGVLAALHGFQAGSQQMPEDYLQELRSGLGLNSGGEITAGEDAGKGRHAATIFKVTDSGSYGGMHLRVVGPVPHDFLRSVGLHLPHSYGRAQSRELFMGEVGRSLKPFLAKAKRAGIAVKIRTTEGEVDLKPASAACRGVIEYASGGRDVLRQVSFYDEAGLLLEVEECLGGGDFVLVPDGTLYGVANSEWVALEVSEAGLSQRFDRSAFNRFGVVASLPQEDRDSGTYRFLQSGKPVKPLRYGAESVGLSLNCSILENAAGEPEFLEFCCFAEVGDVSIDLSLLQRLCVEAVLGVHGGALLSAKRRVRALLDLIRRCLSDYEAERGFDPANYRDAFPELFSNEFRHVVLTILKNLKDFLVHRERDLESLAVDSADGNFLCYQIDATKQWPRCAPPVVDGGSGAGCFGEGR